MLVPGHYGLPYRYWVDDKKLKIHEIWEQMLLFLSECVCCSSQITVFLFLFDRFTQARICDYNFSGS
jgi:hypothetical protein